MKKKLTLLGTILLPFEKQISQQKSAGETEIAVFTDGRDYYVQVVPDIWSLTPLSGEWYKCTKVPECALTS
ncbi:MAG: hypothetical protein ACTSYJ_08185 [Candidatus Thorarchaeota archaeon]